MYFLWYLGAPQLEAANGEQDIYDRHCLFGVGYGRSQNVEYNNRKERGCYHGRRFLRILGSAYHSLISLLFKRSESEAMGQLRAAFGIRHRRSMEVYRSGKSDY